MFMQSWPIKAKPLGSWFPKRAVISLQALRGWFLFVFLETNHAQFSHAPENDTTEDNTTVWSLMNFLVLLWVGYFHYI
jgi:hypothetical protein